LVSGGGAGFLFRLAINTVTIFLTASVVPGVDLNGIFGAAVAALVLTAVNTFIRPVLVVLTLPITIATLGLFIFVLNGLSLLLTAWIVGDFLDVSGLGPAILAWVIISLLNWLFTSLFKRERVTLK